MPHTWILLGQAMKDKVIFITKTISIIAILFTYPYYWLRTVILHFGAGLRYGCLWLFRRGQKVSYRQIRYGSEDFSNIVDYVDNNLANGFLGFLVLAVILILIAK